MERFKSFDELRDLVDTEGIVVVTMEDLRDLVGVKKLGVHVRKQINDQLDGAGLGFFPRREEEGLPTYQEDSVRIYRKGSAVATVIEAVLFPTEYGDERLREAAGGERAQILKEIRALVCS